jgi:hypothetical protein
MSDIRIPYWFDPEIFIEEPQPVAAQIWGRSALSNIIFANNW